MPLTNEEISLAYRVVLNRVPSPQDIAHMVENYDTIAGLRSMLLISDEFTGKYAALQRERDAQRRPTLIQLHVPKTGGTTLAEALTYESHLLPNAVYHDDTLGELRALSSAKRRQLRYIRGHLSAGAGEALGAAYRYLVVIRRAGPRIYSFFRFIQRNDDHPAHDEIMRTNMSFGQYLEFSLAAPDHRAELDNGQLRRLAGQMTDRNFDRPDLYLRPALHTVLAQGTILGFTEHMPALLRQLQANGFLSSTEIDNHNVAPNGIPLQAAVEQMTNTQRQIYDDYTCWDDYFYDLCLAILPPERSPS